MPPAQKGFKTVDSLIFRMPGWLIPQLKLIAFKRLRKLLKKTGFCRRLLLTSRTVNRPAVAAFLFNVMQGCISLELQLMQRFAILRIEADPALIVVFSV
jgi:hypothetical protein